MGYRLLACAALALLGFAAVSSAGSPGEALYVSPHVSPLVPQSGYRAAAGMPPVAVMTEVSPDPYSQPEYDWRMNQQDWRFRLSASLPFGLLLIALSLRRATQARRESGGRGIAMVSVRGQGQPS